MVCLVSPMGTFYTGRLWYNDDMQTYLTLNNGKKMPTLGLGTWKLDTNVATETVRYAVEEAGYRHIDCASIYGNEAELGEGFAKILAGPIKREELFVTSKLWNTAHHPDNVEKACKQTLKDLQLDYLDLYLVHWGIAFQPGGGLEPLDKDGWVITENVPLLATWEAMEGLVKKGLVRSIGVSNFTVAMLLDLLTHAKVKPVTNQVELHPYLPQLGLLEFCTRHDIVLTAYSPLAHAGPAQFEGGVVEKLAKKYHKTIAQVLLNWAVSRGTAAIPKASDPKRVAENIDIFDFAPTKAEQAAVAALDKKYRTCDPSEWWGVPYFA